MRYKSLVFSAIGLGMLASAGFAQTNYKIRQVMTMQGQKIESTTYVRGPRKRTEQAAIMGYGGDVATVEQCDLKRDLKISDKKRMYSIEPFATDTGAPATPATRGRNEPVKKGGVVTYVSNIADTGERKPMFGMTARHVKTSMTVESSPDACSPQDMKIETDGWYIDLPEFSCPMVLKPQIPQMGNRGGCQDTVRYKTTGSGKIGFPLEVTQTMSMGGGATMTTSTSTVEFSKAPLDAALFDIPQGYTVAANSQDLYGRSDMAAMMRGMNNGQNSDDDDRNSASSRSEKRPSPSAKRPGVIRIGVMAPSSRSSENLSASDLQSYLIEHLSGGNVEAVPVASEEEARGMSCDYVLSSDISKLKQSTAGKIGGMFGKVTSTGVGGGGFDVQVDYRLVGIGGSKPAVANKVSNKSNASSAQGAAESVLAEEAQAVLNAAH